MSSVNRHPRDVQLMIQGFTWLSLLLFVGIPASWAQEADALRVAGRECRRQEAGRHEGVCGADRAYRRED